MPCGRPPCQGREGDNNFEIVYLMSKDYESKSSNRDDLPRETFATVAVKQSGNPRASRRLVVR